MKNILEISNLTKSYGNFKAVENFDLDVKKGEILGLLGPNGSGKTTTINSVLGLLKIDSGKITIFDKDIKTESENIKKDIGIVTQNIAVFDELTVYENIYYFCGLYIKDNEECKKLVEEAIKLTGLENFKKYFPKKLSGGLLRRLNIACGIAHKPKLLFLDEPTVAVDPQSRNNILEGIKKLNKEGTTIVYTTHYMEEAEILCDRIVIMDKGNIKAMGTVDELKSLIDVGEKIHLELKEVTKNIIKDIENMKNVSSVSVHDNIITVYYSVKNQNIIKLLEYIKKENLEMLRINSELPTLNDVFLKITGKDLRD